MNRTLLYWPEAADDPAVAGLLDEVELDDLRGPEDPEGGESDEGSDEDGGTEGEEWAPEVPAESPPENELD